MNEKNKMTKAMTMGYEEKLRTYEKGGWKMSENIEKKVFDIEPNPHSNDDDVEEFLNKGINEVIKQYPKVKKILEEYDIGCTICSIGTCLLKDIVKIHNLSPEREQESMASITKLFYPNKEIKISQITRKAQSPREIKYSPPIKKLVEEHVLIKRWVALIPFVVDNLDFDSEENKQVILDGVDFIRFYADQYHHAKEEKILFNYFDENLDILKVMLEDHEKARMHVRVILDAMKRGDSDEVIKHLDSYREILTEHIKKEDEILYPLIDEKLSITQIGKLFSKFKDVDQQFGDAPKKYEKFIKKLENKFKVKEEVTK